MLQRILSPHSRPLADNSVTIYDFTILASATLKECSEAFILHGVTGGRLHTYQSASNLCLGLREMGAGSLRPGELGKHHVRALVELHDKAGRPATARYRHSALVRLYGWLQAVDAIEDNPASSVRVPPPPPPRTNVPSAQAVKALWDAAGRLPARRPGHRSRAKRRARS